MCLLEARHRLGWLGVFAPLLCAQCGDDTLNDRTRGPQHTPTFESLGVTTYVKLARLRSSGTDGTQSVTAQAQATFFDPPADFHLLDYVVGDCQSDTTKREIARRRD